MDDKRALIVGIDHYVHMNSLTGCVYDARAVKTVLERHADGTPNFITPRLLTATGPTEIVDRDTLRDAVGELFASDTEIALLYFAGHGYIEDTGGFLCASDCRRGDHGLPLDVLMTLSNQSKAKNKVIILDSCHSGVVADQPETERIAKIKEGMTILTASTADQRAAEVTAGGAGVFTSLLIDALNGAAANLVGDVTPGSVYAHIDRSLGPWGGQRPVFKTNVKTFVSLRRAAPPISRSELRELAKLFPHPGYIFPLDPSYEPERQGPPDSSTLPPPDRAKTAIFATLQNYVKVGLLLPLGAPHMWHAAIQSKSCKLTVLGEHYRELVAKGLI